MPRQPGTRLGPYELLAPLGAGGMGEVYRARDTRLDRSVAIKLLPENLSNNPDLQKRFEREARAISSLSHPHICTLHDVGREDGAYFLVMEYLEGETLAARLSRGALPLEETLHFGIQIADALDKAHRSGVVHRDLKPGNIMLTKSGVKLLDFGLAKAADPRRSVELSAAPTAANPITAEGTIVGTVQYMSPEQLEGKEADARSDIFSFGAVLYEMATGKRAFEGSTQASLIAAIMKEAPRPLAELAPMTPPALERAVKISLAKDPETRWQSIYDLKRELEWLAEGGSQAGMPAPVVSRRKNRELAAWGVAAALMLSTVVFAAGFVLRAPQPLQVVRSVILPPEGWSIGSASLSADGKILAFIATDAQGKGMLWVRPLDSQEARPLPGTERAIFPFWSPDSRFVAFFADGKLKKMDLAGGAALALCDAPWGRGGTWNRDDVIVFAPAPTGPLLRVLASGGTATPVTKPDTGSEWTHRQPHFLPDGEHFLFVSAVNRPYSMENIQIELGSLAASERKVLLKADSRAVYSAGHLLFVRGDTLMAQRFDAGDLVLEAELFPLAEKVSNDNWGWSWFVASQNGVLAFRQQFTAVEHQLTWYGRDGKPQDALGQVAIYEKPRISRDGQRVAVTLFASSRAGSADIWLFDAARNVRTRFTFDPAEENFAIWSPDGKQIAFRGATGLSLKPASGVGDEQKLIETTDVIDPSDWSPDGKYILYNQLGDLWLVPVGGDRKPLPFIHTPFSEGPAVFSPDGRWVAYVSNESGRAEVYVVPFPNPTAKWQVSTNGGRAPRWRADGREIFYIGPQGKLMAVEAGAQGPNFVAGKEKELFQVAMAGGTLPYDVARDGRFLIVTTVREQAPTPITLVVNWHAGLQKK